VATEAAQQVLDASVDPVGLSITSATMTAEDLRHGSMYNPLVLAAGVPVWFHPLQNSQYVAVFRSHWINATVGTSGPQSYTDLTEAGSCWVRVAPPTGGTTSLGKIPTQLPGEPVINGAATYVDFLFAVGNLDGAALIQHHRVTLGGSLVVHGEELMFPGGNSGVLFDKGCYLDGTFLVVLGTDDDGNVYQCRRNWGRIGVPDTTPGWTWQYRGEKGWLSDPNTLAPIGVTSAGPVSVAKFKDRLLLSVVETKKNALNLVIDPTFEDTTIGRNQWWAPSGGSGYSTGQAHSGTHSIKLVEGVDGWDGFDLLPVDTTDAGPEAYFHVTPGQQYYSEIWVYPTTSVGHIDYAIGWIDSTGTNPPAPYETIGASDNTFIPTPPANTWTKLSGYNTVPPGYDRAEAWFELTDDAVGLTVYVDDPVVREERLDYSAQVYAARATDPFGRWKRIGSAVPLSDDTSTYLGGTLYFQPQISRNPVVPMPAGAVAAIPYVLSVKEIFGAEQVIDTAWGLWPVTSAV